jgi:hypothetical protein
MPVAQRIRQGLTALRPRPEDDEAVILSAWLTGAQQAAFRALPVHDRGHLIRVGSALIATGTASHDLIVAGLLHDLGKQEGSARVRLVDRVAKVCLERTAPDILRRLADRERTAPLCRGLMLAVHHPEIGSERARFLGCTERVCWLIKNHDNQAVADEELRRLIAIDRATP